MTNDIKICSKRCQDLEVSCPNDKCRSWIDYQKDNNCSLISIQKNGNMTLSEISERLAVPIAKVHHIQARAIHKIKNSYRLLKIISN